MLVWRTLKRYEETGNIQNRPGQGRPFRIWQNRSGQEIYPGSGKRVKCVVWNHVNCSPEGPEHVPIQACQETPTFSFLLLTFKMARCKTSFSVMRRNWMLNTTLKPKNDQVWSRNRDEGSRVMARKQCPASLMDWAAVTCRVRKKFPHFC